MMPMEYDPVEQASSSFVMWPDITLGGGDNTSGWIYDRWVELGSVYWSTNRVYDQNYFHTRAIQAGAVNYPNPKNGILPASVSLPGHINNWRPNWFVKHNNVIYIAAIFREIGTVGGTAFDIPQGTEPGVPGTPQGTVEPNPFPTGGSAAGTMYEGNGTYWIPATDYYNNTSVTRPIGCASAHGCNDSSQWNVDPFNNFSHPNQANVCTPIVLGCNDPSALNYYPAVHVNNGNCIYPL